VGFAYVHSGRTKNISLIFSQSNATIILALLFRCQAFFWVVRFPLCGMRKILLYNEKPVSKLTLILVHAAYLDKIIDAAPGSHGTFSIHSP
jgi:hypothetical protein